MARIRIAAGEPGWVHVTFPYDPELVEKIKTVPGRKYDIDGRFWRVPYQRGIEQKLGKVFFPEDLAIAQNLKSIGEKPETTAQSKGRILAKFENQLKLKGYSHKTRQVYMWHGEAFIQMFDKKPNELGETEARTFLVQMLESKDVSHAYVSQALSAMKILFRDVLNKPKVMVQIPRPKKYHKLPEVLSRQEILRFFAAIDNSKHLAIMSLM